MDLDKSGLDTDTTPSNLWIVQLRLGHCRCIISWVKRGSLHDDSEIATGIPPPKEGQPLARYSLAVNLVIFEADSFIYNLDISISDNIATIMTQVHNQPLTTMYATHEISMLVPNLDNRTKPP